MSELKSNFNFDIYPNPVKDNLNISFDVLKEGSVSIQLFSVDGKLIKTFENANVDQGVFKNNYSTKINAHGSVLLKLSVNP